MADANRTAIAYAVEDTAGTTPSTIFQDLRYTGESLNYNVQTTKSAEIRSDRMTLDTIPVMKSCSGAVNFEFSYGTYDAFLESALMGAWTNHVLKNAATKKTFSLERAHLDVTEYFLYKGMMVSSMSMNIAAGSVVTGSFEFMGQGHTQTTSTASSAAYTAQTTTPIFNAIGNVGTILENESQLESGVYIQSINFTLSNGLRPYSAIGYDYAPSTGVGSFDVTGSMTMYFETGTIYNRFIDNEESALSFTLTDNATSPNAYVFLFPKIKYESAQINSGGIDTDVMATFNFRGLKDTTTTQAMLQITRDPG